MRQLKPVELFIARIAMCLIPQYVVAISLNNTCQPSATPLQCDVTKYLQTHEQWLCSDNMTHKIEITKWFEMNFATIKCFTNHEDVFGDLPNLQLGLEVMQISQCPWPEKSIADMISCVGINKLRSLELIYTSHDKVALERSYFKGLQRVEKLFLDITEIADIPEDLFEDFTNLTKLSIEVITGNLPRNIFAKLVKLERLHLIYDLDKYNFEPIHSGLFSNQKHLKVLKITGGKCQSNIFEGLVSIVEVALQSCNMEVLQPETFHKFAKMTYLIISGNHIQELPNGLLTLSRILETFQFISNTVNVSIIPDEFFGETRHLMNVSFKKAKILKVGSNVFKECQNLIKITMSYNHFTELPNNTFVDLVNLLLLDLSHNQLESIDGLFGNTRSLETLDLSYNKIRTITISTFENLQKLQKLIMNFNDLHKVHDYAFKNTQSLSTITLDYNNLESLSPFIHCSNLITLHVRNNEISTIDKRLSKNLLLLRELDLSFNNISKLTIDDVLFESRNINIKISNNAIDEFNLSVLEAMAMNLTTATNTITVDINNNPFKSKCDAIHLMKYLKGELISAVKQFINIKASDLKCSSPPPLAGRSVASLDKMQLLCSLNKEIFYGSYDCPGGCSCAVRPMDRSLLIDCSGKNLTKVPKLPDVEDLEKRLEFIELNIANNLISSLPLGTTQGFDKVRQLNASFNKISHLGIEHIPKNLSHLDVSANHLQTFNFSLIKFESNLKSLMLSKNPYTCDCESVYFYRDVVINLEMIRDYNEMTCSDGRFLLLTDFCQSKKVMFVIFSVMLAILGLIIGILLALFYKYKEFIMVWTYAHNIRIFSEDALDETKTYDAFISYSHKDEDFIVKHLKPRLENGPTPYKLCLHDRDWLIGEYIPTQIVNSVEKSRRTIIVLSHSFLESTWAKCEFLTAHTNACKERRARVIVIIYGNIGDESKVDPAIQTYLKTNTYIKWGDPWFWERLRFALPHHDRKRKRVFRIPSAENLELLVPSPKINKECSKIEFPI